MNMLHNFICNFPPPHILCKLSFFLNDIKRLRLSDTYMKKRISTITAFPISNWVARVGYVKSDTDYSFPIIIHSEIVLFMQNKKRLLQRMLNARP